MPTPTAFSILMKKENAHDDPIYTCTWSKTNTSGDSKDNHKDFIVTGGLDCLVKVWLFESNKLELVHSLEGHSMAVVSVAVSHDGHTIASTSMDSTLILWDLTSGQKVRQIQTETMDVWKVVFSPDGSHIATGSHKGKVALYDLENDIVDKVLDTREKFMLSLAWSPDSKHIATGAEDGIVCILDTAQGKVLHRIEAHSLPVRSVAFSGNNEVLVTASNDGKVKVFDVASANLLCTQENKDWVLCVCMPPDGSRIAYSTADGSVTVLAVVDSVNKMHTFKEHTDLVFSIHFNAEGTKLVSASKDKSIIIYEIPTPAKKNVTK